MAIAAVRARSSQNFLRASRTDGDEAFAAARVGDAHHFRGGVRDGVVVVADDVAEQHHLRQAAALGLGRVADRVQIALVEMLEAGEDRAASSAFPRSRKSLISTIDGIASRAWPKNSRQTVRDVLRHPVQRSSAPR